MIEWVRRIIVLINRAMNVYFFDVVGPLTRTPVCADKLNTVH